MNSKTKTVSLILSLIIACFSVLISNGAASALPIGGNYTWSETTYSINKLYIWDNEMQEIFYEGITDYSYDYSYIWHNYTLDSEGEPLTYMEVSYEDQIDYYYSKSHNIMTMSGNMTSMIDMNVYRVDYTYGDGLQLIWMALKDQNWIMDMWVTEQSYFYNHTYIQNGTSIRTETVRYYENNSIVGTPFVDVYEYSWNDTFSYNSSEGGMSTYDDYNVHQYLEYEFSMPMILTMQIYRSENNKYIAWADMFYNYIIYNDTDNNGIYSAGMSDSSGSGGGGGTTASSLSLCSNNNEYKGMVIPIALDLYAEYEAFYKENGSQVETLGGNQTQKFPDDKTIEDLSSTIEFTPPSNTDNKISWDIKYPGYPLYGMAYGEDYSESIYNIMDYDFSGPTPIYIMSNYSNASPADYSFGFDYSVNKKNTDLDFTLDFGKITNESLYNGVNDYGYSLSMPHYTYMMASDNVEQCTNTLMSRPADLFDFQIGGISVAEIDMVNPIKKNYTLYDYPSVGINSLIESQGGTIAKILTSAAEQNFGPYSGGDPFASIVFSLEDLVSDNPAFENFYSYYGIETQNYPTWAGRRIIHDPTFRAYYNTEISTPNIIDGYLFIPLIVVSTLTIIISIKRIRRRKDFN